VLLVGRWLAGLSQRWLTSSLKKTELTESFVTLIKALSYYTIMILAVVVMLAILGVPIEILAGGLGVVLVVLAISLQTSLGNLAATVTFLLFKPFQVGDVIEAGGKVGVVREIQLSNIVERVKKEFDTAGIVFPLPQQGVHLFTHDRPAA
jgi:small conductance mechanosensitive channel